MFVWRICKRSHLRSAFRGIGAERVGGRWNHKGVKIVYTSANLSLAALELFVHLDPGILPDDLRSVWAELPDEVSCEELSFEDLPRNWRDQPAPDELRNIGSEWAKEGRSLILNVPSAVNPEEKNVLINPDHPEFSRVKIGKSKPFHFDPRMWRK